MRSSAADAASSLASFIARARASTQNVSQTAASSPFTLDASDQETATAANTVNSPVTASRNNSAAWEDFYSHPVIGTSEDGLPIVGETEKELALTWTNATRYAASHGQDMDNTSCIQTRLPVHDGVMGTKIGYQLATAVQLTGMTPIVDSDLTG